MLNSMMGLYLCLLTYLLTDELKSGKIKAFICVDNENSSRCQISLCVLRSSSYLKLVNVNIHSMETSKQANNHGIMVRLGNTNHLFLRGQHKVRDVGGVDASDMSGAHAPCSTVIHVQTTQLYRPPPHHCISSLPDHAPPCNPFSSCTGP